MGLGSKKPSYEEMRDAYIKAWDSVIWTECRISEIIHDNPSIAADLQTYEEYARKADSILEFAVNSGKLFTPQEVDDGLEGEHQRQMRQGITQMPLVEYVAFTDKALADAEEMARKRKKDFLDKDGYAEYYIRLARAWYGHFLIDDMEAFADSAQRAKPTKPRSRKTAGVVIGLCVAIVAIAAALFFLGPLGPGMSTNQMLQMAGSSQAKDVIRKGLTIEGDASHADRSLKKIGFGTLDGSYWSAEDVSKEGAEDLATIALTQLTGSKESSRSLAKSLLFPEPSWTRTRNTSIVGYRYPTQQVAVGNDVYYINAQCAKYKWSGTFISGNLVNYKVNISHGYIGGLGEEDYLGDF